MMINMPITLELDPQVDAAYIRLSDAPVARSCEVNDEVYVDLDQNDMVVGIETLRLDAAIPFVELETRFHVHSDVIDLVRRIRPNPGAFVGFTSASDSSSSPLRNATSTRDEAAAV